MTSSRSRGQAVFGSDALVDQHLPFAILVARFAPSAGARTMARVPGLSLVEWAGISRTVSSLAHARESRGDIAQQPQSLYACR